MTNKEKLLKLLVVAKQNGWVDDRYEDITYEILSGNITIYNGAGYSDYDDYSLNDLALNWEDGQISFIAALFKKLITEVEDIEEVIKSYSILFKTVWVNLPTSQRLDYLFTTFKDLL